MDVHEVIIPGPPGIRYEATPGRKTASSTTFIGRVYERADGGGMQLWACDHKHPDQVQARDCAVAEANAISAQALADYRPSDDQDLRDQVELGHRGIPD